MEETKWSIVSFLLCIFCSGIFLTGCGMAYFTDNYVVTDDVLRLVIAFLLLDPLYLSVLCSFFGGGDMNGIALLCPEWAARCLFCALLLVNGQVFWRRILPVYRHSFSQR